MHKVLVKKDRILIVNMSKINPTRIKMIYFRPSKNKPEAPDGNWPQKKPPGRFENFVKSNEKKIENGHRKRRIVTRDELFEDCEELMTDRPKASSQLIFKQHLWQQRHILKPKQQKQNKLQMTFNKAIAQPIKLSKAESMMQKMGWDGGALGKTGGGIVEPIIPNLIYAQQNKGFGVNIPKQTPTQQRDRMQKRQKKVYESKLFRINVLRSILEFVSNEKEVEILFDCKLHNGQRKEVHQLIEVTRGPESEDPDTPRKKNTAAELDLIYEIAKCNRYVLITQSEGQIPNRYLCVYKKAPPFMYVVTHLDLRDEPKVVPIPDDFVLKRKFSKKVKNKKQLSKKDKIRMQANEVIVVNDDDESETVKNDVDDTKITLEETLKITENDVNVVSTLNENVTHNNETKSKIPENSNKNLVSDIDSETCKNTENVNVNNENLGETSNSLLLSTDHNVLSELTKVNERIKGSNDCEDSKLNKNISKMDIEDEIVKETQSNSGNIASLINSNDDNVMSTDKMDNNSTVTVEKEIILSDQDDDMQIVENNCIETESIENSNKITKIYSKAELQNKIADHFAVFAETDEYTEFKFLGNFENDEFTAVNEFIRNFTMYLNDEPVDDDGLVMVMRTVKYDFALNEDCNGGTVISKVKKGFVQ